MKFKYTGIRVRDLDRSVEFYTRILGMRLMDRSKIATTGGEVAVLQSPGSHQVLELNFYGKDGEFSTPYVVGEGLDHLAFQVKDVVQSINELRSKGVEVVMEPFVERCEDGSSGKLAYFKDPNGIWIELFQMK